MTKRNNYTVKKTPVNMQKLHEKFRRVVKHAIHQPTNAVAQNTLARIKARLEHLKQGDFVDSVLAGTH